MTQFIYGSRNTVLAIGCAMQNEIPTPFVGFMRRQPDTKSKLSNGAEGAAQSVAEIEANGGTVIWFDTPDAAERFHRMMGELFSFAEMGSWGDREEETIQ
jgi:hypothetical protein